MLSLLCLLLGAGLALHAQDMVKLKDGSMIRGTIIEYIAGDHVRIKTEEGKVYEYAAADIKSTEVGGSAGTSSAKTFTIKTKGYYNITGLGMNFGNNYGSLNVAPGLYMVNGWQWNKHLMTGIGAGVEYLNRGARFPLTVDARWKFGTGKITPYVGLLGGYTLSARGEQYNYYDSFYNANSKERGGVTSGAQVGFISQGSEHLGLNVSIGYRYQQLRRDTEQGFWNGAEYITMPVTEISYLNRVTIGVGLLFN